MPILFVENHARFARIVAETFLSAHNVTVVPSIVAANTALSQATFDIALVDFDLDDGKGDELVATLIKKKDRPTIIAISSHEPGNQALLAAGADGVCSKLDFKNIVTIMSAARAKRNV
ncbi:MAG TPA: response regulator [Abditibacteriaceae bacterium]|jgi:DNA-binding response OmpR family regulator